MAKRGLGRGSLRPVLSKGRRVYEADWSDASGQRRRRLVGERKEDAERVLAKIIRDRDLELAGMLSGASDLVPFEQIAVDYLAEYASRARPRAVREVRAMLERMQREIGLRIARDVTRQTVSRWRLTRFESGMGVKTISNYLATLNAALNHALGLGLIPSNPIAGLRPLEIRPEHLRRKPRALSEHEIVRFLEVAAESDRVDHPDRFPRAPLIRAFIETGARYNELAQLTWSDFDEERRCVYFRAETTKTKRERAVPITAELVALILTLHAEARRVTGRTPTDHSRVFLSPRGRPLGDASSLRKHVRDLYTRAGIPHRDHRGRVVNIQCWRTTMATRLARHNKDPRRAQLILGHSTPTLTMSVYQDLELEELRSAVESLPQITRRPAAQPGQPPAGAQVRDSG